MQTTEYTSPEMPENRSCNMGWGRQGGKGGRDEMEEKKRRKKTLKYGVREGRKEGQEGHNKVE